MPFENAFIPYGCYWSTPFSRWQGSFSHLHPLRFAALVTTKAMKRLDISPKSLQALYLGTTVPSRHAFYGAPWVAAMVGAPNIGGTTIAQACATSTRILAEGALALGAGHHDCILALMADKTSNGPHIYYPEPGGPGGKGITDDWVWDNFGFDPWTKGSMLQTAENVATEGGFTLEQQHEVVLLRYGQYQKALDQEAAFLKRFMDLPFEVKDAKGRKVVANLSGDEGIQPSTPEGLARLHPVMPEGTVTFGSQTHPADGNCGLVVATKKKAEQLSRDPSVKIQLVSYGEGRAKQGFMAQATRPAALKALEQASLQIADIAAIKTHNPFAVNDLYLAQELGVGLKDMNNFGSSLIWGHPQAPTGARLVMELIEELVMKKGGKGLFVGCAAGDTAASLVVDVQID